MNGVVAALKCRIDNAFKSAIVDTTFLMKPSLCVIAAVFWGCCAVAAPPAPSSARTEIDALLARLQASGCQFNRNASWYSASEAKDHLLRKLDAIENWGTLQSAEQFIELAASKSSLSGQDYQVKCEDQAPVASQVWLTRQLTLIREALGKH